MLSYVWEYDVTGAFEVFNDVLSKDTDHQSAEDERKALMIFIDQARETYMRSNTEEIGSMV